MGFLLSRYCRTLTQFYDYKRVFINSLSQNYQIINVFSHLVSTDFMLFQHKRITKLKNPLKIEMFLILNLYLSPTRDQIKLPVFCSFPHRMDPICRNHQNTGSSRRPSTHAHLKSLQYDSENISNIIPCIQITFLFLLTNKSKYLQQMTHR